MSRKAIQGMWELVSYTAQDNHGGPITYPLGPDALGLIMYTGDGYMSAQLMRRGRPAFDRPESDGGTAEQTAAAAAGYLAYSAPIRGGGIHRRRPSQCQGVATTQLAQRIPAAAQQARRRPRNAFRHHSSARRYRNHQHIGVEMRPGHPTE